jgi:hypothetical protein
MDILEILCDVGHDEVRQRTFGQGRPAGFSEALPLGHTRFEHPIVCCGSKPTRKHRRQKQWVNGSDQPINQCLVNKPSDRGDLNGIPNSKIGLGIEYETPLCGS